MRITVLINIKKGCGIDDINQILHKGYTKETCGNE